MASLKENTLYLYLLTASNYCFGIATIPYLTRVLGPEVYGNLGFAMAIGMYFNLVIDFGFILSGTKRVANYSDDSRELSVIFTGISIIKILFAILLFITLSVLSLYVTEIHDNYILLILFLLVSSFSSLLPDYLYRGLEDMKMVTFRGVLTRGIFTILIFIFLHKSEQVYLVPLFQFIGGVVAFVWVYWDIYHRYQIKFCKVEMKIISNLISESFPYFLSRIASAVYNVTNTVILGFIYPGNSVVGYYSSTEKFKSIASQGCSPIADSFYPYMIRSRDYNKLFKVTFLIEIPILILCIIGFIWARSICQIAFGNDYIDAYILLRWMIPIIAITLPTYMFGFPALTPIGKAKWANISVEIAMLNQLLGLIILFLFNNINAVSLCILTLISESVVCLIRIICLFKYFTKKVDGQIDQD